MRIETTVTAPDFALAQEEMSNMTDFLKAVGATLKIQRALQRAKGIDPYDHPYTPLTEAYKKRKLAKYGPRAILVASGKLWNSYNQRITRDYLVEAFSSSIARFHQGDGRVTRLLLEDSRGFKPALQKKFIDLAIEKYKRSLRKLT